MADLAGFRQYAVIGSEESDSEVQLCLLAAKEFAKGAGVSEPSEETPSALYDMLVYRLATFYHDNRSFPKESDAEYIGIGGMILQVREG